MLVLEVAHEVVVHLGRYEGCGSLWCTPLVAGTYREYMAVACIETHAALAACFAEGCGATLTVGVLGKHTIAHVALACHRGSAHLAGHHEVPTAYVGGVVSPEKSLLYLQCIVVSELVALAYELAFTIGSHGVDVVLNARVASCIFAQGVGVDVVEALGTEQIIHRLVVATNV